jgi:hypothetical protein
VKGLNFDEFISGSTHKKHAVATIHPTTTLLTTHPEDGERYIL